MGGSLMSVSPSRRRSRLSCSDSVDDGVIMNRIQSRESFLSLSGFKNGDRVRVLKESRLKGASAIVLDPSWHGLVKVELERADPKGRVKSFLPVELELVDVETTLSTM